MEITISASSGEPEDGEQLAGIYGGLAETNHPAAHREEVDEDADCDVIGIDLSKLPPGTKFVWVVAGS